MLAVSDLQNIGASSNFAVVASYVVKEQQVEFNQEAQAAAEREAAEREAEERRAQQQSKTKDVVTLSSVAEEVAPEVVSSISAPAASDGPSVGGSVDIQA